MVRQSPSNNADTDYGIKHLALGHMENSGREHGGCEILQYLTVRFQIQIRMDQGREKPHSSRSRKNLELPIKERKVCHTTEGTGQTGRALLHNSH